MQTSYNKVTHTMNENSVDSGSVSLDTPFASASAEFSYEKSKNTTSGKVTTYVTGKYKVRKVEVEIDLDDLKIAADFEAEVTKAFHDHQGDEFNQYYALLTILNERGYYVPKKVELGGVLMSSDHTTITNFSETDEVKQSYGGSFKASFDGIGGGASYKHAQGSSNTTTNDNKFQITSFDQIGGRVGTSNDYNKWAASLDKVIYWDVIGYNELYPIVGLFENAQLMNQCLRLMERYNNYPNAHDVQPYLNMVDYSTSVQALFSSPWGD